ncbi:MAG: PA0069 family radical SAM protein [Bacteroidetes bacterium]|nr:PA0069 family radical SAM protein [Bacteroidota bacterium]
MSTTRGTSLNLPNRFDAQRLEAFDDGWDQPEPEFPLPQVPTEFYEDRSKSIISTNDSPDVPMEASINPYRGCEHGCAYCYARPSHEYLGFNSAIDFESKIMVKKQAAELLRARFEKNWKPQTIMLSGNTDCYQPAERHFKITRSLLEVLLEFRNPVAIVTKNALVTRDIDILSELATLGLVHVVLSVTTLDLELSRQLEPRTATPERKLAAIKKLTEAGIPVGVLNAPIIPGLNDLEMPRILEAAKANGASMASYQIVRLSYGLRDIFKDWLEQHRPLEAAKVLKRIEMVRGGALTDSRFGARMNGEGAYADYIKQQFRVHVTKYGLNCDIPELRTDLFRIPGTLFG